MREQILKIDQIKILEELYPRNSVIWFKVNEYVDAKKAGAVFPPIVVGKLNGEYILIDGRHRIQMYKSIKQDKIQAQIYNNITEKEIYVKSVELNTAHGVGLSTQEKLMASKKLLDYGYDLEKVANIVSMSAKNITKFTANRLVNSVTGEEIMLKAPCKGVENITETTQEEMRLIYGRDQMQIINNFKVLLKNDIFEIEKYRSEFEFIIRELNKKLGGQNERN